MRASGGEPARHPARRGGLASPHRGPGHGARDHRPRGRRRLRDRLSPRRGGGQACRGEGAAGRPRSALGRGARARRPHPRAPPPAPRRDRGRGARRAGGAANRAARAPVEAHAGAGGVAADPAQRRCSSRSLRGGRLDRRPCGPDGQERSRGRPQACRYPGRARRGPASRAGDDRPAHPDLARAAGQPEQADRRVPPGRTLGRRARRRRRWPWPSRSTGARTTSSPST